MLDDEQHLVVARRRVRRCPTAAAARRAGGRGAGSRRRSDDRRESVTMPGSRSRVRHGDGRRRMTWQYSERRHAVSIAAAACCAALRPSATIGACRCSPARATAVHGAPASSPRWPPAIAGCGDALARRARRARRMPPAEARRRRAVRDARGARRTAASPTGARSRIFVAVLPANTLTPQARSAVHPRRRARAGGVDARAVRARARRSARARATSCWSTSAAPAARRRCAAPRSSRATPRRRSRRDPVPQRRAPAPRELAARRASTSRNTRPPRGSPTSTRCARRSATRRSTCGAARYGTRVAQEYLRRHPERVRSDGARRRRAAGDDASRSTSGRRARRRSTRCSRRARSRRRADARIPISPRRWRRSASALGRGRDVGVADPRTGATARRALTFDMVLGALQPLTYAPELASLAAGDARARARRRLRAAVRRRACSSTARLAEQMNAALHYLGDLRRGRAARRRREARQTCSPVCAHRRWRARNLAVCDVWPRGDAARGLRRTARERHAGAASSPAASTR